MLAGSTGEYSLSFNCFGISSLTQSTSVSMLPNALSSTSITLNNNIYPVSSVVSYWNQLFWVLLFVGLLLILPLLFCNASVIKTPPTITADNIFGISGYPSILVVLSHNIFSRFTGNAALLQIAEKHKLIMFQSSLGLCPS
jgi:hypothetical protein